MSENQNYLTTGELAKLCGVTNRTVQYYEEKGLLIPSKRSEGGRRLFGEEAVERMRTICVLKSLGLSLAGIKGVMESGSNKELLCLLKEQERVLSSEIAESSLALGEVRRTLHAVQKKAVSLNELAALEEETSSVEMNEDHEPETGVGALMSRTEKKQTELKKFQKRMIAQGIVVDIVEIAAIVYGVVCGNWIPALMVFPLIAVVIWGVVNEYHEKAAYICPHCGKAFKPRFAEFFFSSHTPKARKLTCAYCDTKSWCTETDAASAVVSEGEMGGAVA